MGGLISVSRIYRLCYNVNEVVLPNAVSKKKMSLFFHSRESGNPGLVFSGFRVKPGMTRRKGNTDLFKTTLENYIRFTLHEIRMITCKEQFETIDDGLLVRAPAKINLSLLIAGKRPDGFHEIETIIAKVTWYDEILIEPGEKAGIELICKGPQWSPAGKENLVYRAAKMLLDNTSSPADLKITLIKNIPAGTGLGSASSDAAATLIGVNKTLQLRAKPRQLSKIAASLGSDVPFFLNGPLAKCKGKGEKIKKLNEIFNFLALLILPDVTISTEKIYENYQHDSEIFNKLQAQITDYLRKNRIDLASKMCANMLAKSCYSLVNSLAELKIKAESLGIKPLCLSGSGSAMFCIIEDGSEETAKYYSDRLKKELGCKSIIVKDNRW
jgi:4-diphosphocytidyl-2-C-methyl-D-erythritol kinase